MIHPTKSGTHQNKSLKKPNYGFHFIGYPQINKISFGKYTITI